MRRREWMTSAIAASATATIAAPAIAQGWPSREVTIIVAVGPGSSADAVARGVARVAARELNMNVQVKNVLGGAGLTGFAELAASKPDGHVFGLVNVGGLLVFPHIMKVPYTWDSFAFLGGVAENYFGVGIATDSPIKTIADLVAAAKTRRVTYAASAIMNGVAMIQLGNATGTKFYFVPASTQPEAVAQAVGGHVDVVLQTPPDLVPMIEGGKLRLLASATERRWPRYPDIPTLKELGHGIVAMSPYGICGPRGVPPAIVRTLHDAFKAAAFDPAHVAELAKYDQEVTYLGPEDYGRSMREIYAAEKRVVDRLGLAKGG